MDQYLMEGRYYQFVGRIREWISTAHNEREANFDTHGQRNELVDGTTERRRIPLKDTELRAGQVTSN
jgi:hypothetical protein